MYAYIYVHPRACSHTIALYILLHLYTLSRQEREREVRAEREAQDTQRRSQRKALMKETETMNILALLAEVVHTRVSFESVREKLAKDPRWRTQVRMHT